MGISWIAAALLDMEKPFNRIVGYPQLWVLDAKVKDLVAVDAVDQAAKLA